MKHRILQLSLSYAPNWKDGGPPRIMYDLAKNLIRLGHEVLVITSEQNKVNDYKKVCEEINIFYVKSTNFFRKYYFNHSFFQLINILLKNKNQYDFLHLPQTRSIFNLCALLMQVFFKKRIILSAFGSAPLRNKTLLRKLYDYLFLRPILVSKKNIFLAQTGNEEDEYVSLGVNRNQIHMLPLAVDSSESSEISLEDLIKFKKKHGIDDVNINFTFLGRLHPTKNVLNLIKAFSKLVSLFPSIRLFVVGDDQGSYHECINYVKENNLEDFFTFTGPIYANERWKMYLSSSCYVISPRVSEETPLAAIEALSCSTPVITNKLASIPDLDLFKAGFECEDYKEESIRAKIKDFLALPQTEKESMSKNALNLFNARFKIDSVTRKLVSILDHS